MWWREMSRLTKRLSREVAAQFSEKNRRKIERSRLVALPQKICTGMNSTALEAAEVLANMRMRRLE